MFDKSMCRRVPVRSPTTSFLKAVLERVPVGLVRRKVDGKGWGHDGVEQQERESPTCITH